MGILSIWSLVCGVILKTGEPFGDGSQLVEIGPTVQGFDIGPHLWGTTFSASWLVTRQRASVAPERALPPPCLPTKVSRDSISYLCWVFGHRGWTRLLPLIWLSLCLASLTTPASFKVNVASFTFPFFFFLKGMVPSLPFMDILIVGRKYHFVPILLRLTHQEMGFGSLSKALLVPSKKIKWFSFWSPLTLNYRFPNSHWSKLYSE